MALTPQQMIQFLKTGKLPPSSPKTGGEILKEQLSSGYTPQSGDIQTSPTSPVTSAKKKTYTTPTSTKTTPSTPVMPAGLQKAYDTQGPIQPKGEPIQPTVQINEKALKDLIGSSNVTTSPDIVKNTSGPTHEERFLAATTKQYYVGRKETGEPIYVPEAYSRTAFNINKPDEADYNTVIRNLETNRDIAIQNIGISQQNIDVAQNLINQRKQYLQYSYDIEHAQPGTVATILVEGKEQKYNLDIPEERMRAANIFNTILTESYEAERNLPSYKSALTGASNLSEDIGQQIGTVKRYKGLGYQVDVEEKDTGLTYSVHDLSTGEIYKELYGEGRPDVLIAASISKSFGIESLVNIGTGFATGGKEGLVKAASSEISELQRYAVEGQELKARYGEVPGLVAAIGKSPAFQASAMALAFEVATPVIASGIGGVAVRGTGLGAKITTGISGFKQTLSPTGAKIFETAVSGGRLALEPVRFVAGTAGRSFLNVAGTRAGKFILGAETTGAMFIGLEGPTLIETYKRTPELFPGALAFRATTWGMIGLGTKEGMDLFYRPPRPVIPKNKFYPDVGRKPGIIDEFITTSEMKRSVQNLGRTYFSEDVPSKTQFVLGQMKTKFYDTKMMFVRTGRQIKQVGVNLREGILLEPGWEYTQRYKPRLAYTGEKYLPDVKDTYRYNKLFGETLPSEYEEFLMAKGEKIYLYKTTPNVKLVGGTVTYKDKPFEFSITGEFQIVPEYKVSGFTTKRILQSKRYPEFETGTIPVRYLEESHMAAPYKGYEGTRWNLRTQPKPGRSMKFYGSMEQYGLPSESIQSWETHGVSVFTKEKPIRTGLFTKGTKDYGKYLYYYDSPYSTIMRPLTRKEYFVLYEAGEAMPYTSTRGFLTPPSLRLTTIGRRQRTTDLLKTTRVSQGELITKSDISGILSEPTRRTGTTVVSRLGEKLGEGLYEDTKLGELSDEKQDVGLGMNIRSASESASDMVQGTMQESMQKLSLRTGLRSEQLLSSELSRGSNVERITQYRGGSGKVPSLPRLKLSEEEKEYRKPRRFIRPQSSAFDVYVKERSMYKGKIRKGIKFKKINRRPLTESEALNLGATVVDESSAVSFKLKPIKGKPEKLGIFAKNFGSIQHKFRRQGEVFIEKPENRIDTSGELKDVSALGWISNRQKKMLGKRSLLGSSTKNKQSFIKTTKKRKGKNVRYI